MVATPRTGSPAISADGVSASPMTIADHDVARLVFEWTTAEAASEGILGGDM